MPPELSDARAGWQLLERVRAGRHSVRDAAQPCRLSEGHARAGSARSAAYSEVGIAPTQGDIAINSACVDAPSFLERERCLDDALCSDCPYWPSLANDVQVASMAINPQAQAVPWSSEFPEPEELPSHVQNNLEPHTRRPAPSRRPSVDRSAETVRPPTSSPIITDKEPSSSGIDVPPVPAAPVA